MALRLAPLRRVACALLACAWLVCATALAQDLAPIPKLDNPVVDTTGTLDATQKSTLEQQALALQKRKGSQLQVLMVPTTQPETIEQYTVRAFEQYKLGRKKVDDGVLVVVAKDDHRVRIEPGYGLEGAIPDAIANRIIQEYLVPKFRSGDYGGGLIDGTAAIVKLIDGEPLPEPMADNTGPGKGDAGRNWIFPLFVAFIVANFARGIFRWLPAGLRGLAGGAAAGGIAWLLSSALLVGGIGAFLGLVIGLSAAPSGRFARHGGWGGGGFGGGGFGGGGFGGGGGGWGGGGGMSGGGGASGSW
ncbi:TPM domain-containing protein [Lysobacter sp. KIS68-7]|uniref:TPM domain-containing protein n=1 Tax=Lysobacter sp. KIS68-7 TaxID=2904252 RepID=UPI001E4394C5|nr:TPM domain-containing protein [Lysobacter sp. KIS68-7]UHQ20913.1 TPM domain-containing protein [Lysobacter sp. KIS68-7]